MAATPVRASFAYSVTDTEGRPIAGASIEVRQVGTTTKITETIYQDATGASTLSNPFTADSLGQFRFYLKKSKRVDLYVSATGYTAYTLQDVDVVRTGEHPTCIVVAASNAPDWQKLGAHYVCDGTADQEEILAALADGKSVELTQGMFCPTQEILIDGYSQTLKGQGITTEIKQPDGTNLTNLVRVTGDSVILGCLLLNGNSENNTAMCVLNLDGVIRSRIHDLNLANCDEGIKETNDSNYTLVTGLILGSGTTTPLILTGSYSRVLPSGGMSERLTVVQKGSYTVLDRDSVIAVDASTGAKTIALPAVSNLKGMVLTIKKIDASGNAVTVDGDGDETIDGAANYSLATQWKYVTVICDGDEWFVIANN